MRLDRRQRISHRGPRESLYAFRHFLSTESEVIVMHEGAMDDKDTDTPPPGEQVSDQADGASEEPKPEDPKTETD
jgi:hypothetical protein